MITLENILRCPGRKGPDRPHHYGIEAVTAGWITNGHMMAFVGALEVPGSGEWWPGDQTRSHRISTYIAAAKKKLKASAPLTEIVDWRIPFTVENLIACDWCKNKGKARRATCEDCYDVGKVLGLALSQRVYETPTGNRIRLDDRYGALFEGYDLRWLRSTVKEPVAALNDKGELVGLAMGIMEYKNLATGKLVNCG